VRLPVPPEVALVDAVRELAALYPHLIRLVRTPSGTVGGRTIRGAFVRTESSTSAPEGWPDLTGWVPQGLPRRSGKGILVECKRARSLAEANGLLTPEQRTNLLDLIAAGGVGILAWDAAQFWAEYLDAVGMVERGGLIVPVRKLSGAWRPCECERRLRPGKLRFGAPIFPNDDGSAGEP
jgi:hypothetical protein